MATRDLSVENGQIFTPFRIPGQRGYCVNMEDSIGKATSPRATGGDEGSASRHAHAVARDEWNQVAQLPTMGKI